MLNRGAAVGEFGDGGGMGGGSAVDPLSEQGALSRGTMRRGSLAGPSRVGLPKRGVSAADLVEQVHGLVNGQGTAVGEVNGEDEDVGEKEVELDFFDLEGKGDVGVIEHGLGPLEIDSRIICLGAEDKVELAEVGALEGEHGGEGVGVGGRRGGRGGEEVVDEGMEVDEFGVIGLTVVPGKVGPGGEAPGGRRAGGDAGDPIAAVAEPLAGGAIGVIAGLFEGAEGFDAEGQVEENFEIGAVWGRQTAREE